MKQVYLVSEDKRLGPYERDEWRVMLRDPVSILTLQDLGYTIEEVKEKRRELWINEYNGRLSDISHGSKEQADNYASDRRTDCIHLVELRPGERVVNREDIEAIWASTFKDNANTTKEMFLKALGME